MRKQLTAAEAARLSASLRVVQNGAGPHVDGRAVAPPPHDVLFDVNSSLQAPSFGTTSSVHEHCGVHRGHRGWLQLDACGAMFMRHVGFVSNVVWGCSKLDVLVV